MNRKGDEPQEGAPVLRATGLSLRRAGAELTFPEVTLARGESLALLGRSGSGKTTLLHLLAGLLVPRGGRIWLAGRELTQLPETERDRWRARHVGYLFQELHLLPWVTTLENVLLPFELTGTLTSAARELARERLAELGLGERLSHFPRELSGGMQMRVALARALVTRPRVLLLDEPFAALDERTRFRLEDLLLTLRVEYDLQYVFVTHSISEAVYLGDRVLLLDTQGRLRADQPVPLGARTQALKLEQAFTGHVRELSARFHDLEVPA